MYWKFRRRETHSRHCCFRPSVCPLCAWETPPRPEYRAGGDRADGATGEQLLARHMTSAHRHHALQLDKEHTLFACLDLKKHMNAFLSCSMSVDAQVRYPFIANMQPGPDPKHHKRRFHIKQEILSRKYLRKESFFLNLFFLNSTHSPFNFFYNLFFFKKKIEPSHFSINFFIYTIFFNEF